MSENFSIIESVDVEDLSIRGYLNNRTHTTFYHLPEYVRILASESNQKFKLLLCINKQEVVCGYLPLVTTKGFIFNLGAPLAGKRLSSLPRTPVCGPIYDSREALKFLLTHAVSKIRIGDSSFLQVKSNEPYDEICSEIQSFYWRKNFVKSIPTKNEKIYYKNHQVEKEVSRLVRKAERDGIQFYSAENISDLENWYEIYLENARFHLAPARSIDFFKNLWKEFHPKGMIKINLILDKNNSSNKPVAGTLNFRYKDKVWGGYKGRSMKRFSKFADDVLHHFEFLQAQNDNYKIFDLGEVAEDDLGLENYKKKWGVTETKIYHSYYSKSALKFDSELHNSLKRKMIEKIWNSVPLNITSIIGKKINSFL